MAFNGSGSFVRLYNWVQDRINGIKIRADRMDAEMDGIATGLSNTICRDGQSTTTAQIDFAQGIGTDDISEESAGAGVTIDGVLIKDGRVDWTQASNVASAGTTSIGAIDGNYVVVTGTTTITSFGAGTAGMTRIVRFSGALTLTHNGTSLILATGANRTTAAGDVGIFVCEGSSNWREVAYSDLSEIQTSYQPLDADLTALAGLTSAANKVPYFTGSETAGLLDFKDEDDMSSDSATAVPSQQSVKAYVDDEITGILGWTHIQTQVAAADTAIDFALPSGYRTFRLTLDVTCSATSDVLLRVSNDGGSSFVSSASSYTSGTITPASTTALTTSFNNSTTQIRLVTTPFTDEAVGCVAMIYGARESGLRTTTTAYAAGVRSGVARGPDFNSGQRGTAETNDAIRVLMASGNFTGNVTLEGLKTS